VEIAGEDAGFVPAAFEFPGGNGFANLAEPRAALAGGGELYELLGDRRATGDDAAGTDIAPSGAAEGAEVDAGVGLEALVFEGDGDAREILAHLGKGDGDLDAGVGGGDLGEVAAVKVLEIEGAG